MNERKAMKPGANERKLPTLFKWPSGEFKWSRGAFKANIAGALLTFFAVVLMYFAKLRVFLLGTYRVPLIFLSGLNVTLETIETGVFYATVAIGGFLALFGALLCLKRKFYPVALGVTLFGFILSGNFLCLLALIFLLLTRKEFAQKAELVT